MNYFDVKLIVFFNRNGDIAQLARAPALQAGGPGFESLYLHQRKLLNIWRFSLVSHTRPSYGANQGFGLNSLHQTKRAISSAG